MRRGSCERQGHYRSANCGCGTIADSRTSMWGSLFVVGEERDSLGAQVANEYAANEYAANAKGAKSRFLINGEPTENRLALASKGTLRVEVTATGRMAHSAYPEFCRVRD